MELVVQDAADNFLYSTSLAVDTDAGTLAIALPDTVTLPLNEPHYWTLSLACDPDRPAAAVFVRGTIERAAAEAVEPFSAGTVRSLSQAQAYARAGIWHDALTVLGELRRADGGDFESQEAWAALLEQVGLEQVGAAPIQPCCELE